MPWLFEKRKSFELLNQTDQYSRSFSLDGQSAQCCFEVSSQGEFQQVKTVIEELLKKKVLVELIYASESLEGDIQKFITKYDKNLIRVLRLPLIYQSIIRKCPFNLFWWVSARKIIFVRYDFYPHLLGLHFFRGDELYLIWGSLKGKLKNSFEAWYWKGLLKNFKFIYAASDESLVAIEKCLGETGEAIVAKSEFRLLSIEERLKNSQRKIEETELQEFVTKVKAFQGRRIILGSAYADDFHLISELLTLVRAGEVLLVIAPHHLDKSSVEKFKSWNTDFDSYEEFIQREVGQKLNPILFLKKGVLSELYQYFDFAYVGGGFQRSIHSVLEPYWAGCYTICGPKVFRSTEYDFIQDHKPDIMQIINPGQELRKIVEGAKEYRNQFKNRNLSLIANEKQNLESLLTNILN